MKPNDIPTPESAPAQPQPCGQSCTCQPPADEPSPPSRSRRNVLAAGGMLGMSSLMGAAALMTQSDDPKANVTWAETFQKNYRLMTPEEKAEAASRLALRYSAEYRKDVTVSTKEATPGVVDAATLKAHLVRVGRPASRTDQTSEVVTAPSLS